MLKLSKLRNSYPREQSCSDVPTQSGGFLKVLLSSSELNSIQWLYTVDQTGKPAYTQQRCRRSNVARVLIRNLSFATYSGTLCHPRLPLQA